MKQVITLITLALLLNSGNALAAHPKKPTNLKADEIAVFLDEKYTVVKTKTLNGIVVDEKCASQKNCEAKNALNTKKEFPSAPHPAMQNPAAHYCTSYGAKNLVAVSPTGGEVNFCRFKDGSYINSWNLFYKHFPKTTVK
ncbi:DUF333 domain-containing protein [Bdellovibrio bacteriovorus]